MSTKSFAVNWRLVQLLVVMFLLLVYSAIDGTDKKTTNPKPAFHNKAEAPEKTSVTSPLLARNK